MTPILLKLLSESNIYRFAKETISDLNLIAKFKTGSENLKSDKTPTLNNLLDMGFNGAPVTIIDHYNFYLDLLTEILTINGGCNVRKVFLKEPTDSRKADDVPRAEKSCLFKIELPNNNLLYWGA